MGVVVMECLSLSSWGLRPSIFSLTSLNSCDNPYQQVVHDNCPLEQYLVMPDECAHPAEGGLEGREPICGLFGDIERYLCTICNPLRH